MDASTRANKGKKSMLNYGNKMKAAREVEIPKYFYCDNCCKETPHYLSSIDSLWASYKCFIPGCNSITKIKEEK